MMVNTQLHGCMSPSFSCGNFYFGREKINILINLQHSGHIFLRFFLN